LRGSGCKSPAVATAGYYEPSIVFLGGTETVMADGPIAAEFLAGGTCRFALIDTRYERSFALRAEAIGLRYFAGPHIDGFNISNGHRISLAVFHSALAP
jgi:hypothetical protein